MTSSVRLGFIDRSGEKSHTTLYIPQITAANHDAVVGAAGNVDALRAAIAAASLCNYDIMTVTHSKEYDIPTVPADDFAQRELGLEVSWVDNVNPATKGKFTIPGPDLDAFAEAGTDIVDLEEVAPAALKLALETYAVSSAGNAMTITQMRVVGRRN